MKKLLALTMLSALLLTACMPKGEDVQGRFGAPAKVWSMTLSASSPSGMHSVSTTDTVLAFDMKLPKANTLAVGSMFTVDFMTDLDIDPLSDGTVVTLKADGTTIGTGTLVLVDPSIPNEATALITTTKAVSLTAATAKTFTVVTDTDSIMVDESGVDDPLTMSVEHNGKTVTGITLTY